MANTTYTLLDSGNKKKLEQIGPYTVVRPAAQALWQPRLSVWPKEDATFIRLKEEGGQWKFFNPELKKRASFPIELHDLKIEVRLTDFGHIGLFPEHHANPLLEQTIQDFSTRKKRAPIALNLFAYTGILSLKMARAGAEVVHLDASKTSVAWARHNAELSNLQKAPIRWIIDDVKKFVGKEIRRGKKYDIIILDPPSYGRGNKGEIWKLEDDMTALLSDLKEICSDDLALFQLSAHSPGISPLVLQYMLEDMGLKSGVYESMEMTVVEQSSSRLFPSGVVARYHRPC